LHTIFEGYQTSIPIWVYIILFCLTSALAWWSYKDLGSRTSLLKYLLIGLRSLVFLILLLVLINPVLLRETQTKIKPHIAVLLDNSKSMTVTKGKYQGKKTYDQIVKNLQLSDTSDVHYDLFKFDQKVNPLKNTDSLNFKGNETNLNNAFNIIEQSDQSFEGVLLLSDGIFTLGRNPSYAASHLNVPVYTVGMGDTTHMNDIVLQHVETNTKAYLHTISPINVTLLNDGFPNKNITIDLKRDGKVIAQKSIHTSANKSSHNVEFDIKPQKTGIQQYEVAIPKLQGEWTSANNQKIFTLNVLNDKIKILDLAFEIHPDVKTIRSILETDKSIQIYERTWISGNRFLGGNLPTKADSLDLIILHGFPNSKMPTSIINKVYDLSKDKPVLLITTPLTDFNKLNNLYKGTLPLVFQKNSHFLDVDVRVNNKQRDQSILDLPTVDYSKLPNVKAFMGNAKPAIGSKILYLANYHNAQTNNPLLAIRTVGNKRVSEINFFNFYKWYQDPESNIRPFAISLINNVVKWTSTSPDNRLLKINPVKKVFNESDNAVLTATLHNQNGELENQANIAVQIHKMGDSPQNYSMENEGLGQYKLSLGNLPKGIYEFKATAKKGNMTMGTQNGQFSVGATSSEFINTTRNDAMLKFIAQSTGGKYFPFDQSKAVHAEMEQKGLFKPEIKTTDNRLYLYRSVWWFVIIVLLLTSEWGIRKYLALP